MKQSFYFIVLFSLLISCSSPQQKQESELPKAKSDLQKENIRGQVAVIITETYESTEKFGVPETGKFSLGLIGKFNLDGNYVSAVITDENNEPIFNVKYILELNIPTPYNCAKLAAMFG